MKPPRIGFRLSAALARRVRAAGPDSAAARALILLGLHALGEDLAPYFAEGVALLPALSEASTRDALRAALFNIGSTSVQHMLNTPPEPVPGAPARETLPDDLFDDPLGGVGIEV
jgi:hypothetical protein